MVKTLDGDKLLGGMLRRRFSRLLPNDRRRLELLMAIAEQSVIANFLSVAVGREEKRVKELRAGAKWNIKKKNKNTRLDSFTTTKKAPLKAVSHVKNYKVRKIKQ